MSTLAVVVVAKGMGMLLIILLGLLLLGVGALWLFVYGRERWQSWKVWTRMHRCQRLLSRAQTERVARGEGGTLIVESLSMGFPWSRAWWTEDDILSVCPVVPEQRRPLEFPLSREEGEYPFSRWVHDNYTSLDTGKARLVRVRRGREYGQKLLTDGSKLLTVYVFEAGLLALFLEDEATPSAPEPPSAEAEQPAA